MPFFFLFHFLGGQFFHPDSRITSTSGISTTSFNNARCLDSRSPSASLKYLHIVWMEEDAESIALGPYEIWYGRSTDGGETWQKTRLTYTSLPSTYPSIATDELGQVHIVWCEETSPGVGGQIWYIRSPNDGETWEEPILLSNPSVTIPSSHPAIAVDNSNRVKVVWYEEGDPLKKIKLRRSLDGGETWLREQELYYVNIRERPGELTPSSIANSEAGLVHVSWVFNDYRTPYLVRLIYRRSTDGGETWEDPRTLWEITTWHTAKSPNIAANNNGLVNIIWPYWGYPDEGWAQIWHISSTDGGVNWREPRRLPSGIAWKDPVITSNDLNMSFAVWSEWCSPSNWEIYYRRSYDGGENWEPPVWLTSAPDISTAPFVTIDKLNTLHLIWTDRRDGNEEIYYKKGVQFLSQSPQATGLNQGKRIIRHWDGVLHMVYESDGKVYYSYSLDDGKVWFPPQFVSRGKYPSLILQWTPGTNNYVPWVAYLLNDTIICAIWEPTGWRYHKVFEGNPPSLTCGPPSLCRGDVEFGTYCYVVYSVHQGNPPTNNYIYFNEVFYNGAGEHFIVEEAGAEICRSPSIASIPSPLGFFYEAHVVWERGDRIYYRMRDILRNWLPIERISTEPPLPKTEPASNPSIEFLN